MKARDIMTTDVVCCRTQTDIATAASLMQEGGFGTLPVIDPHGQLAGIVTDRDIAMAAAARRRLLSHITVADVMTSTVWYCFATDDVGDVLKQMTEARVRRLPVVGAGNQVVGIVSVDDIVRRALDHPGGVSSSAFINSFTAICAPRS